MACFPHNRKCHARGARKAPVSLPLPSSYACFRAHLLVHTQNQMTRSSLLDKSGMTGKSWAEGKGVEVAYGDCYRGAYGPHKQVGASQGNR